MHRSDGRSARRANLVLELYGVRSRLQPHLRRSHDCLGGEKVGIDPGQTRRDPTVGERLENQIEEWVVRDNAVAAEAFPHVDCWIGLEIRWLRFSSAHREVADALRRLKDAFSKGHGKLRFLSIDGGRGGSKDGDNKPSRARRNNRSRSAASGGGDGEEASGGVLHQHPLRALSAKR